MSESKNPASQPAHYDADYTDSKVNVEGRRSLFSMFMIMLGFTFFSASMWTGQTLANGFDLPDFIAALILGGLILGAYTGLLGFIGAESGMTLDLLARRSFGNQGSRIPSALIAFTQVGWFGVGIAMFAIPIASELLGLEVTPDHMPWQGYAMVAAAGAVMTASAYFGIKGLALISTIAVPCVAILGTVAMYMAVSQGDATLYEQFARSTSDMTVFAGVGLVIGSFVSGGTATPNFTRFARSPRTGLWVTVIAFFLGNSLMFFFGAVSSIYVGGNDIFEVMVRLGLFYVAILVLGLNIWTTNDNALYTSGLGLSNIFGRSKRSMVLVAGTVGTVLAVWLYWNFCNWLTLLNGTLPPIGAILIVDYFLFRHMDADRHVKKRYRWYSLIGLFAGATVALSIPWGIASINGMATAIVIYLIGYKVDLNEKQKQKQKQKHDNA